MKSALYSGAGNTFLFIDNRQGGFATNRASTLCAVAAVDGLILVENSAAADAAMRIFNRDGSVAEMCGNGLRCFVKFLHALGIHRECYRIETAAGLHLGWIVEEEVRLQFPPPTGLRLHVQENLHFLNTGVPHVVVFVENIQEIDVTGEGSRLRQSPLFAPQGANVNFVQVTAQLLMIRTYERGVEAETLACGTGAMASALIAHILYRLPSPLAVSVRSGERLRVCFSADWRNLTLQGPVQGPYFIEIKN